MTPDGEDWKLTDLYLNHLKTIQKSYLVFYSLEENIVSLGL
jgi:hypothetical protein